MFNNLYTLSLYVCAPSTHARMGAVGEGGRVKVENSKTENSRD